MQPDQVIPLPNNVRIMHEYADIVAAIQMLESDGHLSYCPDFHQRVAAKKEQVERFLLYSAAHGRLDREPPVCLEFLPHTHFPLTCANCHDCEASHTKHGRLDLGEAKS